MPRLGPRAQSRAATWVVVAVVHGVALWVIWQVRVPIANEVESFTSVMIFIPEAGVSRTAALKAPATDPVTRRRRVGQTANQENTPQPPRSIAPPPIDTSTATTLPAVPGAGIDWSAQLKDAAAAALDREAKARQQLGALNRRYVLAADPLNPDRAPASTFRWYGAGVHRIDTRGSLPVLHLNDRCLLVMFIIPACLIGHIETHGDLFDGAAAAHSDTLAAPRPNDAP